MILLTVLSDSEARKKLNEELEKTYPDAEFLSFDSSVTALAAARDKEIDIAFLDVELAEMSGIDLGIYLKELYPFVNIVFISDNRDAAYEAIAIHASGYLLRPVTAEAVKRELEDLRHPDVQKKQKRVFAQTFGNFEFFVDKKPVKFKYIKTKEVVAVLINNRGAQTSNGEIIASLWEDDGDPEKKMSYLSNLRQDLQNTLTRLKVNGIILKQRGSMAIVPDKIECDLFDWLAKKKDSQYQYMGDYMN